MPPSGRPTSCHNCRNRRINCDETRPGCLKCRRSGRECRGYYDASGIVIRDMTSATISKFKTNRGARGVSARGRSSKANQEALPHRGQDDAGSSSSPLTRRRPKPSKTSNSSLTGIGNDDDGSESSASDNLLLGRRPPREWAQLPALNMSISLEEQALCYFSVHYALVSTQVIDPGYIPILRILSRRKRVGPVLTTCLSAVALAAFSTRLAARGAAVRAWAEYAKALKALNLAIQQPFAYNDDELLASTVVLALFELICSDNTRGYASHVYGAAAMVGARGKMMFQDKLGEFLFRITCNNIVTVNLMGLASPHRGTENWLQWVNDPRYLCYYTPDPSMDNIDDDVPNSNYAPGGRDFVSISNVDGDEAISKVASGPSGTFIVPEVTSSPIGLSAHDEGGSTSGMAQILEHTRSLIQAYENMETENAFAGISATRYGLDDFSQDEESLFPVGPVYDYKDLETACLHIAGCVGRIVTCNVMARCAASLDIRGTQDYKTAIAIGRRDVNFVIGSIPYFCGVVGNVDRSTSSDSSPVSSDSSGSSGGVEDDDFSADISGKLTIHGESSKMASSYMALMIMWPMAATATSEFIDAQQFEYVLRMQRYIAEHCGIKLAEGLRKFCVEQRRLSGGSFWTG